MHEHFPAVDDQALKFPYALMRGIVASTRPPRSIARNIEIGDAYALVLSAIQGNRKSYNKILDIHSAD